MSSKNYHLSNNAKRVYEYLLKVEETTKKSIIKETSISEEGYKSAKNELISKRLVYGKRRRTGGLVLSREHHRRDTGRTIREKTKVDRLSEEARKMLENIPEDGSSVGNVFLRSGLGISSEEYWEIRKELLNAELIQTGKGRGGSVARTDKGKRIRPIAPKGLAKREKDLYEPLKKWLESAWARPLRESGDSYWVKITATPRGHRRKSGKYSRPDLTFVQVSSYDYLPGRFVEVTTFEVKQFEDAQSIKNIFEAAAHSRWAHNSYLVVEVPNPEYVLSERVTSELSRFNVGLFVMYKKDSGAYECDERLPPVTQNPDPKEQDELLGRFFKSDKRERKRFLTALGK